MKPLKSTMAEATASLLLPLLLFTSSLQTSRAIEFPNQVQGTPTVDCFVDNIKITVETTQGNPSHIFVKGRHHEPRCVTRNTNQITIKHEECGLQRERSLNPPGVFYRVCAVVQLHPQFVTKVDKTFCASCFYMESVKELTQELGVSVLSSTEVAISFPMPQCQYTIRRGSPSGPEIRFATVGEPVFHVWSCPSDSYGMLVQNCYVDDGQGNRILIVDQNGCGVDRYIMQTPNYNAELNMAFQESHVFKFADKTITRFTCQIKVCIQAGGGCDGISPPENCPSSLIGALGGKVNFKQPHFRGVAAFNRGAAASRFRYVRDTQGQFFPGQGATVWDEYRQHYAQASNASASALRRPSEDEEVVDVSGELFVLEDLGQGADREIYEELLNSIANGTFKRPLRPENAICVPTTGFALILVLFSLLVLVGLSVTTYILMKGRGARRQGYNKSTSSASSTASTTPIPSSFHNHKQHHSRK